MTSADGFFVEKRPWSVIKDKVLVSYLEPYLAKVSTMGNPIRIADTFAGKGRFDDGEPGSPVLICDAIRRQLARETNGCNDIKGVFIEKRYAKELNEAMTEHSGYSRILPGTYEDRIDYFLGNYQAENTHFLFYVDPYGIKSLRFSHFERLKRKKPKSLEVLLNMNAFGFMREGCRRLGLELQDEGETPEYYYQDVNDLDCMDQIAGGDYWRTIIQDYYSSGLTMKDAENQFAQLYREQMKNVFKYVIDIPIKKHLDHIPKYRIIYGTDHEDGLLLMADNMNKRWEEFKEKDRYGVALLFEIDFPDPSSADYTFNLRSAIMERLSCTGIPLKDLLVRLVSEKGIAFSTSQYKKVLKELESEGSIIVRRDPALTSKGRPSASWEHSSTNFTVYVSRTKEWQQDLL